MVVLSSSGVLGLWSQRDPGSNPACTLGHTVGPRAPSKCSVREDVTPMALSRRGPLQTVAMVCPSGHGALSSPGAPCHLLGLALGAVSSAGPPCPAATTLGCGTDPLALFGPRHRLLRMCMCLPSKLRATGRGGGTTQGASGNVCRHFWLSQLGENITTSIL